MNIRVGSRVVKGRAFISEEPGPNLFGLQWYAAFTPQHLFPFIELGLKRLIPEVLLVDENQNEDLTKLLKRFDCVFKKEVKQVEEDGPKSQS